MDQTMPMLDGRSWEDLIPTLCFDGEISYSPVDTTDMSWMQLPQCRYTTVTGQTVQHDIVRDALMTAIADDDDDLGIYLNDTPSSPSTTSPTSSKNISPISCTSSGVFSSSDFDALSPLNFDTPASPEGITREDDSELAMRQDLPMRDFHSNALAYYQPHGQKHDTNQVDGYERIPELSHYPSMMTCQTVNPAKPKKASHKPPESYIALIARSILCQPGRKALLCDIYDYCMETHTYYRTAPKTWKNAIRHNLSVNECFIKSGRSPNGRGYYWTVHPACLQSFLNGDFRRREARQLAVDMDKLRERSASHPCPDIICS